MSPSKLIQHRTQINAGVTLADLTTRLVSRAPFAVLIHTNYEYSKALQAEKTSSGWWNVDAEAGTILELFSIDDQGAPPIVYRVTLITPEMAATLGLKPDQCEPESEASPAIGDSGAEVASETAGTPEVKSAEVKPETAGTPEVKFAEVKSETAEVKSGEDKSESAETAEVKSETAETPEVKSDEAAGIAPDAGVLTDIGRAVIACKRNNGCTALHHARTPELVKLFIAAGIDPSVRDETDRTPLHIAAINNDHDIIRALVEQGADIDAQDRDGRTALMVAISYSDTRKADSLTTKLLLELGARVDLLNKKRQTVLHVRATVYTDRSDVMEQLLDAGADVDAQDADGNTALHLTALYANPTQDQLGSRMEKLLARGASLEVVNKKGQSPASVTSAYSHVHIIKHIVQKHEMAAIVEQLTVLATALSIKAASV